MIQKFAVYCHGSLAPLNCARALQTVIQTQYKTEIISYNDLVPEILDKYSCIAFPGGSGDVDAFDKQLKDKTTIIQNYVSNGGGYLGICMGAYITGKRYFNLLGSFDARQYIKRKNADVRRSYCTTTNVTWHDNIERIYFFDGAAFTGNIPPNNIIATYTNNDCAAINVKYGKGTVLVYGPHPESLKDWYVKKYMKPHWHNEKHHQMLLHDIKSYLM